MENYGCAAFVPRVPGVTVLAGHGSRDGRPRGVRVGYTMSEAALWRAERARALFVNVR